MRRREQRGNNNDPTAVMVGRGQRTDQNYFHCLAARDWGHTRANSLRYAVKGERTFDPIIIIIIPPDMTGSLYFLKNTQLSVAVLCIVLVKLS